MSKSDDKQRDVLDSTFAVLFFGTPHRGSTWVDAGKAASRFAAFLGFSKNSYDLGLLHKSSEMLEILRDDFQKHLDSGRVLVTSFQESYGYKGAKGLDDKASFFVDDSIKLCTLLIDK